MNLKNKIPESADPLVRDFEMTNAGVVTTIQHKVSSGWELNHLLISDVHFDSVKCNRTLLKAHLNEALERGARIWIFGDWFDAMQGRFDPRRNMDELRPEYRRSDYYDFVVADSQRFLEPYQRNIDIMTDGNHELAVLKNANTNLTDRLVGLMNYKGAHVVHGGYGGWIRIMFFINLKRLSRKVRYFHGAGGEAPVTRGVIQTNRQAVYLPDADVVINGHNHHAYWIPISRERLGNKGKNYFDIQHHVRIPGYKQDYANGRDGWEVTRGGVPKPIGAIWMQLKATHNNILIGFTPMVQGAEAIDIAPDLYTGRIYADDSQGY